VLRPGVLEEIFQDILIFILRIKDRFFHMHVGFQLGFYAFEEPAHVGVVLGVGEKIRDPLVVLLQKLQGIHNALPFVFDLVEAVPVSLSLCFVRIN
jgi:hypothetical protein